MHEETTAANEESMAINEELQSTNEELVTSKEEMRSVNADCRRCASGVHSANSIWATTSGRTHVQFFISSFVKAHCVRLRSGRFANGQVAISSPLSLAATARRLWDKAVSHLARVQQCAVLVVPDDDGIYGVPGNVSADH